MRKRLFCFLCAVVFLCACTCEVQASELMEDLLESASLSDLEEVLPADLPMKSELVASLKSESGLSSGGFLTALFSVFLEALQTSLAEEVKLFASLFCVLLLTAFFSSMRQAWLRDSVGDAVDFLSVITLSGTAFYALYRVFLSVREALLLTSSFLYGMLPVVGAVYTVSGGVATAGVQSTLFLTALSVLDALCVDYLLPLFCASFALSAAGAVSGVKLLPLAKFFRRTVSLCLSALFLLLLAVLSVQTLLSASADSLTLRSARFAAANFVPVVGGMFSESAKTVFASLSVLRSSVGVLGVFCVLWMLLVPILGLLLRKMLFSLLSAVSACFSLERESLFLSECAETLGLLASLAFSVSVFFLLGFGVFASVKIGG